MDMKAWVPYGCSFLLFILASYNMHAQSDKIDSLQKAIQNAPEDSNKVIAMKALSRELWQQSKMTSALVYEQRALALNDGLVLEKEISEVENEFSESGSSSSDPEKDLNTELRRKRDSTLKQLSVHISKIEEKQSQLNAAIKEYNRRSLSLSDDRVLEMQMTNKQLATQQQAALQHFADERSRRNWVISSSGIIVVLLTIVFFQFSRRRQTKSKLEVNQLKNRVLRSQLNPHFIFHALNSIRSFMEQCPESAGSFLVKFSTLMRQVLENSEEEKISLSEEIAMIENYMQLEAIRIPGGFDYEVSIDESIDAEVTTVPPLILQPMIENAILHGLLPLKRRGKIVLQFKEKNGLLEATIEDDGIGLGSTTVGTGTAEKKRSMGIQITRERIELLNRKMKGKGSLVQQLFEHGSRVSIAIPV